MNTVTLRALEAFPDHLEEHYLSIPDDYKHWTPPTWDGIPSESLTAMEQICHVLDIERDGYHVRFDRTLAEINPTLASLDTYALAKARDYSFSSVIHALEEFRQARRITLALITKLTPEQLDRHATFEGYGALTLRSLVHYLCSHDQQHLAGLQWLSGKIAATLNAQHS
jgi:DinB superfamily